MCDAHFYLLFFLIYHVSLPAYTQHANVGCMLGWVSILPCRPLSPLIAPIILSVTRISWGLLFSWDFMVSAFAEKSISIRNKLIQIQRGGLSYIRWKDLKKSVVYSKKYSGHCDSALWAFRLIFCFLWTKKLKPVASWAKVKKSGACNSETFSIYNASKKWEKLGRWEHFLLFLFLVKDKIKQEI